MKTRTLQLTSAAAVGVLIGTTAFARWALVAAPESAASGIAPRLLTHNQPLAAAALGALGMATLFLLIRSWRPTRDLLTAGALAFVGGVAAYAALSAVFSAARAAWDLSWTAPLVVGPAAATVLYLTGRRGFVPGVLLACLGFLPWFHSLGRVAGDKLAIAALQYSASPPATHYVALALSVAYLGGLIGLIAGWLLRAPAWRGPAIGWLAGSAVAIAVVSAQLTAFYAAMGSGQNPLSVWAALAAVWVLLCLGSLLAARAWGEGGSPLMRYAPVVVLAAVAAYGIVAARGCSTYLALKNYHADSSCVYVQFSAGGAWRRTFDDGGSASKVRRCQSFVRRFPRSAYRPAALLMLAESQFGLWDFDSADKTLRALARRYPCLRGYADILRSVTHYVAGRPQAILREPSSAAFAEHWRSTQGALLAGAAAERLGRARRALGFYNSYIEFLHTQPASSWSPGSIQYADTKADYLLDRLHEADATVPRGTVLLRLLVGSRPLAGARVALVQPHRDAAFPADSKQFTGAWSIAAWGGLCGVSDSQGTITLDDVPYGSYDVVVGLSLRMARERYVIAPAVPPVAVDGRVTSPGPIQLVPAINQLWPKPGASVSEHVRLAWERYPGAVSYSVSIVAVDEPPLGRERRVGQTCWARPRIPTASATIDAQHFVNGHSSLMKGGSYMWIVYAYGRDGGLLSSSEHYNQLHEPVFTVR